MGKALAYKLLEEHLVSGDLEKEGSEIELRMDQTLTQDATGTMACLQFEVLDEPRVKTKRSVSYIDHNVLQTRFENSDDHAYLQSIAAKYGMYFSRAGNGICHSVHIERFAVPGDSLIGSDSHTPHCGGVGMLAFGAGGLDVAMAMAGHPFAIVRPKIVGVELKGRLQPGVYPKDIILEMLRVQRVKGGVGKIFEYFGEGAESLSVYGRATITNMSAELGATTSVFATDEKTKKFFEEQGRLKDYKEVKPDKDAAYDEVIEINLDALEPLVAMPSMPDNVKKISEVKGEPVHQVIVGSCTNASYEDLAVVAAILKGRSVHPRVTAAVTAGTRQTLERITQDGVLRTLEKSGVRLLESACGPCIGQGMVPATGTLSVRAYNRNFEGRCGTKAADVVLASPAVAAACAVKGELADPRELDGAGEVQEARPFEVNDALIISPQKANGVEVVRGPNIQPLPNFEPMEKVLQGPVLLKVGDDITTDHILPAGAQMLPYRSNIPAISEFTYERVDREFVKRAKEAGKGFIIGGENYGQGSSREHAAIAPRYLGVTAVVAKSFARIHKANLVNNGIAPLTFANPADFDKINQGDDVEIRGVKAAFQGNGGAITLHNKTQGSEIPLTFALSEKWGQVTVAGGLLNYIKARK